MRPNEASGSRVAAFIIAAGIAVYLIFQLHAVAFHGYWGQDWLAHKTWIRQAALDPWTFIAHYTRGRTNPPLYDLIGGAVRRLAGLRHYLTAMGVVDVVLGLAGMGFVLAIVRRLIRSPWLRAACFLFVLFLPFAMIHAEVIANDALATPVFWALLWLVSRFDPGAPARAFGRSLALLALALMLAVEVKFTFGSFIIATAVWAVCQWWTGRLSVQRLAWMLVVVALVPGAFTYAESARFRSGAGNSFGFDPPKRVMDATMNPVSIVGLRSADVDVLRAPQYNLTIAGQYELLLSNKHSLASLLHLAIFTDILNIYQYDPYDSYFGRRTVTNQGRMQTAVRAALPASVLTVVAVVALVAAIIRSVIVRRRADDLLLLLVLVASLGWFLSLVVVYPAIPGAYYSGWWTPRLHAPALLGFFVAAFVWIDRLAPRFALLHGAVLVWVMLQSCLQLSFLWPARSDEHQPIEEYDRDVQAAAVKSPVIRVLSWQEQWNPNNVAQAWMADTLDIIVNRGPGAAVETWTLRFRVQEGPSLPGTAGAIRVSMHNAPEQLVTFTVDREVEFEVPLIEGRNEIRLDLVAPPTVELENDAARRNVRVSKIQLRR